MKTIAVAKGYLMKDALHLLESVGIVFDMNVLESRALSFVDHSKSWTLLAVRPWDVPVYVARGAADFGIVGYDVLAEQQQHVSVLKNLKFGPCSLILATVLSDSPFVLEHNVRVATKYPKCAERWFCEQGIKVRLIKLYGAVELAPLTGLADIICDLTATGTTLKENGLSVVETLFSSTAQLIANPSAMAFYYDDVSELLSKLG
ncbi:MAG: ATP phosphoribosyltransferase [bacterium]